MRDERIDAYIQNCVRLVDEKQLFLKRGRYHKVQIIVRGRRDKPVQSD